MEWPILMCVGSLSPASNGTNNKIPNGIPYVTKDSTQSVTLKIRNAFKKENLKNLEFFQIVMPSLSAWQMIFTNVQGCAGTALSGAWVQFPTGGFSASLLSISSLLSSFCLTRLVTHFWALTSPYISMYEILFLARVLVSRSSRLHNRICSWSSGAGWLPGSQHLSGQFASF